MRVAYIHYLCEDDTATNHARQFAAAAAQAGHEIAVHALNAVPFSDSGGGPAASVAQKLHGTLKRRFSRYLHEPKELVWNLPYAIRERRILQRERPDLVLVRNHYLTFSALWVAGRLALPTVLEVNAPSAESRMYLDQYVHLPFLPEYLEGWKYRSATKITTVSGALKEHLSERYVISADKIAVIPNGADVTKFHPQLSPDREFAAGLGQSPVVGFIGSFERWHGPELLAEMILNVGTACPEAKFLLVGDGPGRGVVQARVTSIADRVHFTGTVPHDHVPPLVACMDVGVMPESNFYGSPLKVVEWMAAGLAVVAPDYGPLREIIEDGVEGILFPAGNLTALTNAVVGLIKDPTRQSALGRAAARRVAESLTWSHNASGVLRVCEEAVKAFARSH